MSPLLKVAMRPISGPKAFKVFGSLRASKRYPFSPENFSRSNFLTKLVISRQLCTLNLIYVQFSDIDAYTLFTEANLRPVQRWTDTASRYSLWLLERPPFMFPLLSSPRSQTASGDLVPMRNHSSSPFGIPSLQDWQDLWTTWDLITRGMVPPAMLFQKPIDLRHICLFYFGHIPTFLDIHLSRLLGQPNTPPEDFKVGQE